MVWVSASPARIRKSFVAMGNFFSRDLCPSCNIFIGGFCYIIPRRRKGMRMEMGDFLSFFSFSEYDTPAFLLLAMIATAVVVKGGFLFCFCSTKG